MADWQPSASHNALVARAKLLAAIRAFFYARGVLEVETPLLSKHGSTDPHIECLAVGNNGFLQSSPEYAMKRLLAAGAGNIYQICKAFRADEFGRLHNAEFTLLEWYRVNFDLNQLMYEVEALVGEILAVDDESPAQFERLDYGEVFFDVTGLNPHTSSTEELAACAKTEIQVSAHDQQDKNFWLDYLFSHSVEPSLGKENPTFVYNYPASQAAMSRINLSRHGTAVAERFELFYQGIELANGYHELSDPVEQAQRLAMDNSHREMMGKPSMSPDSRLIAALEAGLPDCSGVALGVDRLLMLAEQSEAIADVIAFAGSRA